MKEKFVAEMLENIARDVAAGKYINDVIAEQKAMFNVLSNTDEKQKTAFFNWKLAVRCDNEQELDRLAAFSEEEAPLKIIVDYDETFYSERYPYALIVYGEFDYMYFVTRGKNDLNCDIETISFEEFAGLSKQ